ncbi:hypothetical protein ACRS52_19915 [Bacillus cytotoxicus]|nr:MULTISPECIES: hypothetical protein [Bacillus cereus group]MDH2880844.1 hypothetical protein [Bacillus cytotoxicus]QTR77616.1 hypothetical protein JC773_13695 [Bacillus cytotoxicus]QTR82563.1 hypothetical protein JC777_19045 [Bacillus cytotoxicus]QTR86301.1 hypothetical protein JC774_17550 [Bacillus cytotoxicus]HDR4572226.1 hypothetical protein [Bacillus cytotoxicus]
MAKSFIDLYKVSVPMTLLCSLAALVFYEGHFLEEKCTKVNGELGLEKGRT